MGQIEWVPDTDIFCDPCYHLCSLKFGQIVVLYHNVEFKKYLMM